MCSCPHKELQTVCTHVHVFILHMCLLCKCIQQRAVCDPWHNRFLYAQLQSYWAMHHVFFLLKYVTAALILPCKINTILFPQHKKIQSLWLYNCLKHCFLSTSAINTTQIYVNITIRYFNFATNFELSKGMNTVHF
jgi:hypothetical protein